MDSSLKYTVVLVILICILIKIFYWYYRNFISVYSHLPSCSLNLPTIYWILTRKSSSRVPLTSFFLQKMIRVCKQFEHEGLCLIWFFRPTLYIFGEESIKTFSNEPEVLDKGPTYKILREALGRGLLIRNKDTWKSCRKLFNPFFRLKMLKDVISMPNKHAAILVEKLVEVADKPSIDMFDFLPYFAFSINFEFLTGLKSEEYHEEIQEAHHLTQKLSEFTAYRIVRPYLHCKFMLKLFPMGRKYIKYYEAADEISQNVIKAVQKSLANSQAVDESNEHYLEHYPFNTSKSLVQELIEIHSKDPTFTMQDVVDEIKTFLSAGYDTVTFTLMWCIFMLGLHQDVQEQVYYEIDSLSHRDVTYEDLSQLPYLESIIKETMRLYPTIPVYARVLNKETQCGKYKIPNGTEIMFCPIAYHRNSELYPDPEGFDPDRFRKGNSDNAPWKHIAFAEGMRNCIGKNFALMEMKIILVHIIRKFKIVALDRREDVDLDWAIVLKSVRPLRTKLILR